MTFKPGYATDSDLKLNEDLIYATCDENRIKK